MALTKHFLNNQRIDEPVNWQLSYNNPSPVTFVLDFESDSKRPNVSLEALRFLGDTAKIIIKDMEQNGYYQGRPYRIEASDDKNSVSIDCFLDYANNPIKRGCDDIEVAIKRLQGNEWLTEQAAKYSFRYLASSDYNGAGKITNTDYFGVPYVINYIPDGTQLLILAISTFTLTKELVESIQSIARQTTDLIEGATPTVGTSVGLGAGVVTAWNIGKIIGSIINLAVSVAYTIGIVVAIIKLIEQIIEQLAPVKRFHLGMPLRLLTQRGCEALGLELSSTLLDELDTNSNKWVLIPSKGHRGGEAPTGAPSTWQEVGYPTTADGFDNLADVIRFLKRTFNADYRIKDGVITIERKDFFRSTSGYVIPNTFNNQELLTFETSVNASELKANYVIKWATDQQDLNTLDNQEGRLFQAITAPNVVTTPELLNLKGLEEVSIPCSMATRKNELTAIEEALKVFLEAADFLSGQLDNPQSFSAKFKRRIGAMHLSSHFTSIPKMVIMNGDSLAKQQRTKLSALNLWEKYHYLNSFVTIDGKNNQQFIYAEQKIPFCLEDFVSLSSNNVVSIATGETAEIKLLEWIPEQNYATVTYNVYRVFDNTLRLTILT